MNKSTAIRVLTLCAAFSALLSSCLGLLYSSGGERRTVVNLYGETVTLFGDGVYLNDSVYKAGLSKGTDVVVILAALLLLALVSVFRHKKAALFWRCGLLSFVLYASICILMGANFNRLFLLYSVQFGAALFAFILSTNCLLRQKSFESVLYEKRMTGTAVFLIVSACVVYILWLMEVLPPILTGNPLANIGIYTTEPTYPLDLGVVLPITLWCGVSLLKQRPAAYQFAPILLTLLLGIGVTVIFQTVFLVHFSIELTIGQIIGMVVSFVILGAIALTLNLRLLRRVDGSLQIW